MYVSRLNLQTLPGRTRDAEQHLKRLREMVTAAGAGECRILHAHYASVGAPDLVFEQVGNDLSDLEARIGQVLGSPEFQQWSEAMSEMLLAPPKREVYLIAP